MFKRLLHPPIVSDQELVQRRFAEADAFVRLLKVLWTHAVVVSQRKHITVDNSLMELLREIRCQGCMSVLGLMKVSAIEV